MIEIDGICYPMISDDSQDVSNYFKLDNIKKCRFSGVIPKNKLRSGDNIIKIIGIHENKIDYGFVNYTFSCTLE